VNGSTLRRFHSNPFAAFCLWVRHEPISADPLARKFSSQAIECRIVLGALEDLRFLSVRADNPKGRTSWPLAGRFWGWRLAEPLDRFAWLKRPSKGAERSMRRRQFITLLGGAVAWPALTRAQGRRLNVAPSLLARADEVIV